MYNFYVFMQIIESMKEGDIIPRVVKSPTSYERTSITVPVFLLDKIKWDIKVTDESISDFFQRAAVNLLEKEGDWFIREEWEEFIKERSSRVDI